MNGKHLPAKTITPEEAIRLFRYAKTEELHRAFELYKIFCQKRQVRSQALWEQGDRWEMMRLLSFVYDTGRVQGIREQRAGAL